MDPEVKTEESEKSHVIGSISIARDGTWHCHYVGEHTYAGKTYFGNGHLGGRNLRKVLNAVGTKLGKQQQVYLDRIEESLVKPAQTEEAPNDTIEYIEGGQASPGVSRL